MKIEYTTRGDVNGLSRASRKRLFDLIARLDLSQSFTVFLTLTYPATYPSMRESKRDLRAFLERIRRRYKSASGIWRLEEQKRGAPHFHLLLFNLPFVPKETVQQWWAEIIQADRPFTRIEAVKTPRGVFSYVSKYIAKVDREEGDERASVQICDTDKTTVSKSTGRLWGVYNKPALPLAPHAERTFDYSKLYVQLKERASEEWEGVDPQDPNGFSLYTDDAINKLTEWLEHPFDSD